MPSSVVAAIRYNDTTSTLRVIYVSGSIYDYKQVPEKVYKEMMGKSKKPCNFFFFFTCKKGDDWTYSYDP